MTLFFCEMLSIVRRILDLIIFSYFYRVSKKKM